MAGYAGKGTEIMTFIQNLTLPIPMLRWGARTRLLVMQEAISLISSTPSENSSLEYYKYLRERVEKSPFSLRENPNPFFPELYSKKEEEKNE